MYKEDNKGKSGQPCLIPKWEREGSDKNFKRYCQSTHVPARAHMWRKFRAFTDTKGRCVKIALARAGDSARKELPEIFLIFDKINSQVQERPNELERGNLLTCTSDHI
eukprot:1150278-Pelagomonas_calceolata.AAC.1